MTRLTLETEHGVWHASTERVHDLSIPLRFDGQQPNAFGAPPAHASALHAGDFVGDVSSGGSCNCAQYQIVPHCNGTHTECVGHVTRQRVSIRDVYNGRLQRALVISVSLTPAVATSESSDPAPQHEDRLVTAEALKAAWLPWSATRATALVVRTLPNDTTKLTRVYADPPPAYLTRQAVELLVARGIDHLLVDLPSLDRMQDAGKLTGHRIFWGLPPGSTDITAAQRGHATVTELIFVPADVDDGRYLLDLQVAPFAADAAPSRPLLYAAVDGK